MAQEMEPGMIRVCPERDAICPHGMACPYSRDYECDMKGSRAELDRTRAKAEPAPSQEPDRDSLRIARQFADMYRSGAQGAEMDCDAAQALALAIDDILSVPAPSPPADIAGLVERLVTWLKQRGEPNSGISYEANNPYTHRARVEVHGSDATFIVNNFHGQGARELASALQRVAQERDAAIAYAQRLLKAGTDDLQLMKETAATVMALTSRAEAAEARLSSARDEGLEPLRNAMAGAFITANSDGANAYYAVHIKCRTLKDMQRAHEAIITAVQEPSP